ncbi:MAG: tRNA (cytidine(34)-2'-O)-methyltransferase [Clostridiales bacterium]|nr:tRNA (cytidine(34)-2'-O)-methyltransferase [Clostridiales bacterium]
MLHIVLVEPEIPQNTGNIARTCAATGAKLHLIRPLGFEITERRVRRAGLDYWPMVQREIHDSLEALFQAWPEAEENLWLATTKAPRDYGEARFTDGCWLFFGKETAGLPEWFRMAHYDRCIRIPMRPEARSLNLANSVAVVAYEALRQQGFPGLLGQGEMKGQVRPTENAIQSDLETGKESLV